MSKFLQLLWSVNGVLLLLFLIFVLFQLIIEEYPDLFSGTEQNFDTDTGVIVGDIKEKAKNYNIKLQHLNYESPEQIEETDYYFVQVFIIDRNLPKSLLDAIASANDISPYMIGAAVNMIFFNTTRTDVHTLFDGYGYIKSYSLPRLEYNRYRDEKPKRNRDFILYELALNDNNNDGRINDRDSTAFYISQI